jgi:5'-nucleotidase/UDP-sugar diphosphatase
VQAGALKAVNLPPGPVKDVTADSLLAYPDEPVVVIEMQGERLKAALERGLSALPRPQKGFLQVSGIVATYDPKSPPTKRVVRVTLAGKELPDSQRVRVAMPLSLARGYLGFFRVFSDLRRQDTGKTMQQAVTAYVAGKPVLPKPGERLIPTER